LGINVKFIPITIPDYEIWVALHRQYITNNPYYTDIIEAIMFIQETDFAKVNPVIEEFRLSL